MKVLKVFVPLLFVCSIASAQEFGLSFSYFIPKNGYFSTPISPFSIRGLGVNLTNNISIETGGSLYRMSGLNIKGLPFETKDPLVGPNFTIFVPVELVFGVKGNTVGFDVKGGGFFFYGFDQKINYGNMDRAMREYYGLEVVNSNLNFSNKPGFGYHVGAELTISVTSQVGISFETNYLVGQSDFALSGTYTGAENNQISTQQVEFADAQIDFTGLEFSLGVFFNSGGSGPAPKKRRR